MLVSNKENIHDKYDMTLEQVCEDYGLISESRENISTCDVMTNAIKVSYLSFMLLNCLNIQAKLDNVVPLFENIEMNVLPIIAEMEWTGITVDKQYLEVMERDINRKIAFIEAKVREVAKKGEKK